MASYWPCMVNGKPETIGEIGGFMVTGGNANINVVFENHYSKMLPESIVQGEV